MTDTGGTRGDRELEALLPFYVNGTLEGEELAAIEAYLARSETARAEAAYLQQLRHAIKAQPAVSAPGELGLKRLQRELSRERAATETGARASERVRSAQHAARSAVAGWWRPLAIAACLALVVLAGALTFELSNGGGEPMLAGGASAAQLQVTFNAQASEGDIRVLLQSIDASIVDGPSALGVYRLRLGGTSSDATIADALRQLRQRGDLIESAERN